MEDDTKVFYSNITTGEINRKNDLYDLLKVVPAKPLELTDIKKHTCEFNPKTDKFYIPKRKSRLRVKTVRDIRKSFEQDIYTHLYKDLETQEKVLFKNIRRGCSRDENTKVLANNIIKGDTPISRSTWQMLINLNPESHTHPRQYVLWNGKYIQVNGSLGGTNKLICKYDLAIKKLPLENNKRALNQKIQNKKKGILRNSLTVKFKPGPLRMKKYLDESYQKYHVGNVELQEIPTPGLDIRPTYGTALEPTITHFLNKLRKEDGTISRKWAELAVSALGTIGKTKLVQVSRDCVTIDLNYKYNQNHILMRRDDENFCEASTVINMGTTRKQIKPLNFPELPEIQNIIDKILDYVEINLIQDKIYTREDTSLELSVEDSNSSEISTSVKAKKKNYELERLDVTVIRLPETETRCLYKTCEKLHCSLGCVCASLESTYNLKHHCGRVECMFDCKCGFYKYKRNLLHADCSEIMPALFNLDKEINLKLAKEEQKFHQTVIVSGEKRFVLKADKRNLKTSKKCSNFYSNVSIKNENQKTQDLSIVALKLNCDKIVPWCMVHKIYKCFCKGRFTETCLSVPNETVVKEPLFKDMNLDAECSEKNTTIINKDINLKEYTRTRSKPSHSIKRSQIESADIKLHDINNTTETLYKPTKSSNINYYSEDEMQMNLEGTDKVAQSNAVSKSTHKIIKNAMLARRSSRLVKSTNTRHDSKNYDNDNTCNMISDSESSDLDNYFNDNSNVTCSRTKAYEGRKYSNGYYKNTNYKIRDMEKNDKRLRERLAALNNTHKEENVKKTSVSSSNDTASLLELLCDVDDIFPPSKSTDDEMIPKSKRKRLSNETKLVAWLETNYKMYKQRNDKGLIKNTLEPPKLGKVALHSWDFILKRYRERKNLFLISQQQKPFRIFVAVHTRNPFFENCININDIRFADLHKYPQTVKNLLTNAADLKDNFCILRGLSCCWELIGSVTKVNDEHEDTPEINVESSEKEQPVIFNQNYTLDENSSHENVEDKDIGIYCVTQKESENIYEHSEEAGSSKWFVMTIENDFREIRFFKKGFFVKYESIINAISVARLSGKTVRLSSKKCIEQCDYPQFGIYAIPNDNEYCVFVGPYEVEDTLGIESIKTIYDVRKIKKSRGFWITTNKVDNLKVVEDPLSFVPVTNLENDKAIPLENHCSLNEDININQQEIQEITDLNKNGQELQVQISSSNETETVTEFLRPKQVKVVKPIKIRKTNGFYHLASASVLKNAPHNITKVVVPVKVNSFANTGTHPSNTLLKLNAIANNDYIYPMSEIPQESSDDEGLRIKISAVYSTQNEDSATQINKSERGMFILKPEEINRKLLQNNLISQSTMATPNEDDNIPEEASNDNILELDSGNLSSTSTEWNTPKDDIYIISDDEYDLTGDSNNQNNWRDVWIESTNSSNVGWIAGRKNTDNLLSFKLPGCDYSEFYTEREAFTKINSEMFQRIDTSMNLKLQWKVTESLEELQGHKIDPDVLYPDYNLTTERTSDIIMTKKDNIKTYSKSQKKDCLESCSPIELGSTCIAKVDLPGPSQNAEGSSRIQEDDDDV